MSDLVEFLRARLDEDEATAEAARRQVAKRACPPPQVDEWAARAGHWGVVPWLYSGRAEADLAQWGRVEIATLAKDHIVRHDPARVLAEVAVKRELIRVWETVRDVAGTGSLAEGTGARALQLHAAVYADHPDYQERWRP
ncbi:DUF6221 family protein [Streptomyces cacaoi]